MNKIIVCLSFIFLNISSVVQHHNSDDTVLSQIAEDTCTCFKKYFDGSEDDSQKVFIRECLENATEKNSEKLFEYYKIKSFKEIKIKKYMTDMIPLLSKECNIEKAFIKESFKSVISN